VVPLACLVVFGAVWGWLAIAPRYRADWLLENLPVFLAVPIGVWMSRKWRFSDRSYVQMTAFLILHSVGAHYTYSEVPLGEWLEEALDWSRNHYDRIVHFLFGFLLLQPARELAFHRGREPRLATTLALSVACIAALSVVYEIVEWITAAVVDPEAGTAYLGTQGDEWDAQKDMALACLGGVLAALVEAALAGWGGSGERGRASSAVK
jgi:putative membrane protein